MHAILTLVFVFVLLNLTSIWKLPTFSIGGRGRDGIIRIVGPGARFFILESGMAPHGGSPQQRFRPMLLWTVW